MNRSQPTRLESDGPPCAARPASPARCPRILHDTPGRVRLSVPCLRDDPARAVDLHRRLAALDGVSEISPSTTTGNLVIRYDPRRLTTRQVVREVFQNCEVRLEHQPRPQPPTVLRGLLAARSLVKAARALAGGRTMLTPGFGLVWLVLDLLAREK